MGSWYNLIGEDLSNCITNKCGNIPVRPARVTITPQMEAEFQARRSAWLTCKESCEKARSNTSGVKPTPIMDTRPLEKQDGSNLELTGSPKGISKNTILIGVGVLAVVAFFMLRRK